MRNGIFLTVSSANRRRLPALVKDGRKSGHTFTQPDLIIAATAFCHGMAIVSRDTADYSKTRLSIFNPWQDELRG